MFEEGFFVISALVEMFKDTMAMKFDEFYPFIEHGMDQSNDLQVQRFAVGAFQDCLSSDGQLRDTALQKIGDVYMKVMEMIKDNNIL